MYELYLNIAEATNVPTSSKHSHSDTYVQVFVEGRSKKLFSTHTFHATANPKWGHEVRILVPDSQQTLKFHLMQYHKIFKDDHIGTASLNLSAIPQDKSEIFHLPTDKSNCDLLVMAHITPLQGPQDTSLLWSVMDYPPLKLMLERFIYCPGECVRGNVVLSSTHAHIGKKVDWIHLESIGKTHLEIRSNEPMGWTCSRDMRSGVVLSPFEFIWWSVRATVAGKTPDDEGSKANLETGLHVWAFEFVLPKRLPPTYTRDSFWSTYTFSIMAHIDGKVQTVSKDIAIVPAYPAILPTINTSISRTVAPEILRPCHEPVIVQWNTAPEHIAGFANEGSFRVINNSMHTFERFYVHMRSMRIYLMHGTGGQGWVANKFYEQQEKVLTNAPACPPETQITGDFRMVIPVDKPLHVSVPEWMYPELIQVLHWYELTGVTPTHTTISLARQPVYLTYRFYLPPYDSTNPPGELPIGLNAAETVFRVAYVPHDRALPLSIPQTGWVHPLYHVTQGHSVAQKPQATNVATVLSASEFSALNPVTPVQKSSKPGQTTPLHLDSTDEINVEHAESFDGSAEAHSRSNAGAISVNRNLGVEMSLPSFGLKDLNQKLFGTHQHSVGQQ